MAQTYISSIVVQLFIFSIPLIFLYASNRKLAKYFTIILIIAGYSTHGFNCWLHSVTPSLFVSGVPSGQKTVDYFEWVHMHTAAYFASFFIGFQLADYIRNSYRPVGGRVNYRWQLYGALLLNAIGTSSTAIYNSWHLLPQSMVPVFIICVRMIFHGSTYLAILYIFSEGQSNEKSAPKFDSKNSMFGFRLNRIFAQLSIGYYLGNYFYIRTEFFTSRYLWKNTTYEMCKRTVTGLFGMTIMAVFLHLFFVAPFDALRKHFLHRKKKKVE